MSDYNALDYIPVIGDIYRYAKLGYKIGSWIASGDDGPNNQTLSRMAYYLNKVAESQNVLEAMNCVCTAIDTAKSFDMENVKKYQGALFFYLAARVEHVIALCKCNIYENDLDKLKEVSSTFTQAHKYCKQVWSIDKTWLTENRSVIDEIRTMSKEKEKEIGESRRKWRKQYRCLYKKIHPYKWYLGMWIFA